jgi:hypothetical protein
VHRRVVRARAFVIRWGSSSNLDREYVEAASGRYLSVIGVLNGCSLRYIMAAGCQFREMKEFAMSKVTESLAEQELRKAA